MDLLRAGTILFRIFLAMFSICFDPERFRRSPWLTPTGDFSSIMASPISHRKHFSSSGTRKSNTSRRTHPSKSSWNRRTDHNKKVMLAGQVSIISSIFCLFLKQPRVSGRLHRCAGCSEDAARFEGADWCAHVFFPQKV